MYNVCESFQQASCRGRGGICESYVEVIYVNDCMPIMYMILNSMDVWHSPFMLALT